MINSLKAVIFDMDGLMLDTERLAMQSLCRVASSFDIFLNEGHLAELIGLNENDAYLHLKKTLNIDVPQAELVQAFYKDYQESLQRDGIAHKEGLTELLEFLQHNNIKMAVATAAPTALAHQQLAFAGIISHFEKIVGLDQVASGKPAPDVYVKAMRDLDVDPGHSLALEDSDNGARAAIDAGLRVIMVPDLKQPSAEMQKLAFAVLPSLYEVPGFMLSNFHLSPLPASPKPWRRGVGEVDSRRSR